MTEIDRREQSLRAAVIPTLQLIAAGGEIDENSRARCRATEQTARDQLVAPDLVASVDLARTVLETRTRGAIVILSAEQSGPPESLIAFRRLLCTVLADLGPPAVVRARWARRGRTLGTVVVTGTNQPRPTLRTGSPHGVATTRSYDSN